jgi:hypothetical protein
MCHCQKVLCVALWCSNCFSSISVELKHERFRLLSLERLNYIVAATLPASKSATPSTSIVKRPEHGVSRQKLFWLVNVDKASLVHDCHAIKVENSIKTMCHVNDRMVLEFCVDGALHNPIRCIVHATRGQPNQQISKYTRSTEDPRTCS